MFPLTLQSTKTPFQVSVEEDRSSFYSDIQSKLVSLPSLTLHKEGNQSSDLAANCVLKFPSSFLKSPMPTDYSFSSFGPAFVLINQRGFAILEFLSLGSFIDYFCMLDMLYWSGFSREREVAGRGLGRRGGRKREKEGGRERGREGNKEIYYKNWLIQLWRLTSSKICRLQAGDPREPMV